MDPLERARHVVDVMSCGQPVAGRSLLIKAIAQAITDAVADEQERVCADVKTRQAAIREYGRQLREIKGAL